MSKSEEKLEEEVSYLEKGLEILKDVTFTEMRQLQYELSVLEEEVESWKHLATLSALAHLGWIGLLVYIMARS